jgi:hypothetical protein
VDTTASAVNGGGAIARNDAGDGFIVLPGSSDPDDDAIDAVRVCVDRDARAVGDESYYVAPSVANRDVHARCCADTEHCTSPPSEAPTHAPSTTYPTPLPTPPPTPKPSPQPTPQPTHVPTTPPSVEPTMLNDPLPSALACSTSTCADLGWLSRGANDGSSLVCGAPTATSCPQPDGASTTSSACLGCSGLVDWAEARTYCETSGGRLCTAEEVLNDEVRD